MKKLSLLFAILTLAFLLSACAGIGDWASEPLAADFEIWRLSAHNIKLVKRTDEHSARTVVEAEVYAVAWDENTIFVQHETMAEVNAQYTKEPHGELDYYILFVSSEELLGPFTLAAFEEACEIRGLTIPQEWTPVRNLARQRD